MSTLKIAHIAIAERYIEGQSYQENTLSARHADLGYKVFMIASSKYRDHFGLHYITPKRYINQHNVCVTILHSNTRIPIWDRIIDTCKGLYEEICSIKPNIIFIHGIEAHDNRHIFRYKREHPEVRIYADNHNDYYNSHQNKLLNRLFARFISFRTRKNNELFEKFWGTTPWRVNYLENVLKVDKSKVGLLLMGGDDQYIVGKDKKQIREKVKALYKIPNDAFLIVTGGNINKAKQQDILMEVVVLLRKRNVWLLVFGPIMDDMKSVVSNYSQYSNIIFVGGIEPNKVYDLFLSSDIVCFPGTHSVLWDQAIACGIPCIFKRWEGMLYVDQGGNSILLKEVTVQTLKESIEKCMCVDIYKFMLNKAEEISPSFYLTNLAKKSLEIDC